jgi:PAS domain-containing protein
MISTSCCCATDSRGARGPDALLPVEEAATRGILPISAFRYAERTREPLLVDDAVPDSRFDRDPYFTDLDSCSQLVVPILSKDVPRAILLLENRLSRGAFSPERVDAVKLVTGQLAVSLDNAMAGRFRSLVQRSADLTLVTNRSGTISYATASSHGLFGYRHTSLTGRPVQGLTATDAAAGLAQYIRLWRGSPRSGQFASPRASCRPASTARMVPGDNAPASA